MTTRDKLNEYIIEHNLKDKTFEELYLKYYDSKNKKNRIAIKAIRSIVDSKSLSETDIIKKKQKNKIYKSLPSYNDDDFINSLVTKAEFIYNKNTFNIDELSKRCNSREFEHGNHQIFLKNFMNQKTPYRGLLIFHGVGVGKTCSAVTISNCFKDIYKRNKKKIIILVPKNIRPGWINTIYDPSKGEKQCTGDTFKKMLIDEKTGELYERNMKRKIKKMIHNYYEFYGYQEFSNKIDKMIKLKVGDRVFKEHEKDKILKKIEKEVIHDYFSDRLLIIDEVHNIRSSKDKEDEDSKEKIKIRDILKNIEKVVEYSKNMRIVLMSATPMFNKSTEIIWLLNILLKNDKRVPIKEKDIFEGDTITERGEEILNNKCNGYISYLRGENPITFPIRLYPDINKDDKCIIPPTKDNPIYNYPTKDFRNVSFDEDMYRFKFLKYYYNRFQGIQKIIYQKYITSVFPEERKSVNLQISEQQQGKQISNMVYPTHEIKKGDYMKEISIKKLYGEDGLRNCMDYSERGGKPIYTYKKSIIKEYGAIFSEKNIKNYSIKISNILEIVKQSDGIIFIYSEYISSGLLPLAFALEEAGFDKYSGNILTSKRKSNGYKYIMLTGQHNYSPNNEEEIKEVVKKENSRGDNIKIILGSKVASEGLDLKNIRSIHILEPWYHLNRLEQTVGRGIRYCSHMDLDPKDRNVMIYLHTGSLTKEIESIDTYIYRKAESKAGKIGKIELLLKKNAIDCYLNRGINFIGKKEISKMKIRTNKIVKFTKDEDGSFHCYEPDEKYELHDREYTKVCSFSDNCDYTCDIKTNTNTKTNTKTNTNKNNQKINYDTFTISTNKEYLDKIIKIIIDMYNYEYSYTLEEIIDKIMNEIDTDKMMIYFALHIMITKKRNVWNCNGITGYLIVKNEYYIYQPYNTFNEKIPLYYRSNIKKTDIKPNIKLTRDIIDDTENILNKQKYDIKHNITKIYQKIESLITDLETKTYLKDLNNKEVFTEYSLDHLLVSEKIYLLKNLIEKYKNKSLSNEKGEGSYLKIWEKLFIYQDKKDYLVFTKNLKLPIIGFFLCIDDEMIYFIYNKDGIWEIANKSIIRNIQKNFKSMSKKILKTNDMIWGYSYNKNDIYKFKVVNEHAQSTKYIPGNIIQHIAQKKNIIQFIDAFFKKEYGELVLSDIKSKPDLCILLDIIIRNKTNEHKLIQINYDMHLFKFEKVFNY
jgi:hypothetical protein